MRLLRSLLFLTTLVFLATLAVHALPAAPPSPDPIQVGGVVPNDIAYTDIDGRSHTFGEWRGKVVFVHFWSIVCPTEKFAEPKFVDIQKQFGDRLVQIAIDANQGELRSDSSAPYGNLRDRAQKAGLNFLIAVDPGNKLTDVFGATNTPHCFVIDRNGTLRYSGALDDDPRGVKGAAATPYVKNAVQSLLDGKAVEVATTRPYG
jgi:thiol-disulfide isomerase/thioredoxin